MDLRYRRVNGDDAVVLFEGDAAYAVMVMDLTDEGDRINGVYIVTNPDKLTHVIKDETDDRNEKDGEEA
jgi:RNA polymerase sigma-70 factor (ECF subfamily)